MKNLTLTLLATLLVGILLQSCSKASDDAYSYVKKSSRGDFSVNYNGQTIYDTITNQNNSTSFSIANGVLYVDTGYLSCCTLNIALYDPKIYLNIEARKLETGSFIGHYRIGSIPVNPSWWSQIGTFSMSLISTSTSYYGDYQDTTNTSYVEVTSYTNNGKVQELKGYYKLHAVSPATMDITGEFTIRE